IAKAPETGRRNAAAISRSYRHAEGSSPAAVRAPFPRLRGEGRGEGHSGVTATAHSGARFLTRPGDPCVVAALSLPAGCRFDARLSYPYLRRAAPWRCRPDRAAVGLGA